MCLNLAAVRLPESRHVPRRSSLAIAHRYATLRKNRVDAKPRPRPLYRCPDPGLSDRDAEWTDSLRRRLRLHKDCRSSAAREILRTEAAADRAAADVRGPAHPAL